VSDDDFPVGHTDERELYLDWLRYLRAAVLRKLDGLDDEQARWRPDGALLSLLGIANHLQHVGWRWIDGGMRGQEVSRSEEEFHAGTDVTTSEVVAAYRAQAAHTDAFVRAHELDAPCRFGENTTMRWVLVHLINETARHAGHADATRELLDGNTGE